MLLLCPWSAGSAREKLPFPSHCALILLTGLPPPPVHLEQWIVTLAFPQPSSAEAAVSPTLVLLLVTLLDVSVMVLLL